MSWLRCKIGRRFEASDQANFPEFGQVASPNHPRDGAFQFLLLDVALNPSHHDLTIDKPFPGSFLLHQINPPIFDFTGVPGFTNRAFEKVKNLTDNGKIASREP
jgi:hypothetical protein